MAFIRNKLSTIITFTICALLLVCFHVDFALGEDAGRVIAYYFYTTFRCHSCHNIEKYTKEALETYFSEELESGILEFKILNVEEKENEHYINDYQLFTKSVVLSLVKDGKEVKHKNLEQVWQCLGNKEKFGEYIKQETQSFLEMLNKASAP